MPTNAKRIKQASIVVDAYGYDRDADFRTKLIDLLTDLHHAAALHGVSLKDCLKVAGLHYENEKE